MILKKIFDFKEDFEEDFFKEDDFMVFYSHSEPESSTSKFENLYELYHMDHNLWSTRYDKSKGLYMTGPYHL